MGVGVRTVVPRKREEGEQARSGTANAKRDNEREAREYMHGTWQRIRPERAARAARVARIAHIVERGASGVQKKENKLRNIREYMNGTCREHEARVCGARIACTNKLRNLRQTVHGSMRRVHVKTGMLKKRALY
jgi:hypothetical protein